MSCILAKGIEADATITRLSTIKQLTLASSTLPADGMENMPVLLILRLERAFEV